MNEEEFIAQYYYQKKNGEDGNDISEKWKISCKQFMTIEFPNMLSYIELKENNVLKMNINLE
jgi:hypothetical protein